MHKTVSLACTGHASQTIVVYPPTGSTAYVREINIPPTLLWEYGTPLLFTVTLQSLSVLIMSIQLVNVRVLLVL